MNRKSFFTTLISAAALALFVSLPVTAAAGHGSDNRHDGHYAKKHYKGHKGGQHYGHKRGHGYGHYKHGHRYYGRPHHKHGHHYSHSYYPAYPAHQPIMGFMYYLDQKDTYYDRYGYN